MTTGHFFPEKKPLKLSQGPFSSPESENWPKTITAHNTSMVIVPAEVCIGKACIGSWNSAVTGGQRLGEEKVLACCHLNRCRLGNQ